MEDIRLRGPQHVIEDGQQVRRLIRLVEGREVPVVDDLDDGQALEDPPGQLPMPASGTESSGKDRDVVAPAHQRLAERGGVNLRSSLMARKKIVDRVQ